jgi:hypothetical protein
MLEGHPLMEMLNAAHLPEILENFGKVYVIDTEYYPQPGLPDGPVTPAVPGAMHFFGTTG